MAVARQVPLLDLRSQHANIRTEVLAAATRLIDSQKFILGEEVQSFEQEIAAYCGTKFAVGCASGSDALYLALLAGGIEPGDRVVTTPYTFFATAGAISRAGAIPVFVDVDPVTFNIDPELLAAEARARKARAIIPVHLFGACADMDPICEISWEHGLYNIEDAAQAIGAEYKGRPAGSIGHVGCFSFFPSKNLGGYGDGGMLTTDDAALAERLTALRVHGRTGKYIHEWIGINSRLDALQAAMLRVKLRHLDDWTKRRGQNAETYRETIVRLGLPIHAPVAVSYQTRHVYNQFVVRCPDRDKLQAHLKQHQIGCEVYYPLPLHLQKCFADLGYRPGDFPVSERLATETLSLPVNPEVSGEDIEYICRTIQAFYA
jgi:dTDP-4-amino-4,6-dideoxygalactose transaminase